MSSLRRWANLDDLPVELLLKIFEGLDRNLYSVACLSRKLNSFVIPLYFPDLLDLHRHHHLDSVTLTFHGTTNQISISPHFPSLGPYTVEQADCQPAVDILSFLSVGLGTKTVDRLIWEVIGPIDAKTFSNVVNHYRAFTQFLERLDGVGYIFLKLEKSNMFKSPEMLSSSESDELAVSTAGLLNACMEKLNGGENFEMTGEVLPVMDYASTGNSGGSTKITGSRSWEMVKMIGNPLSSISISPGTRRVAQSTRTFKIALGALLHPPLSNWTFQFLSAASLTSFTLDDLVCDESRWNTIFSSLPTALPQLQELMVTGCRQINAMALAQFISNLPHLKYCDLRRTLVIQNPPFDVQFPYNLPTRLTTLISPSNFLYMARPNRLTPLSRLQIVPYCRWGDIHPYPRTSCRPYLDEVLEAYSKVAWIALDMQRAPTDRFSSYEPVADIGPWDPEEPRIKLHTKIHEDSFRRIDELVVSKYIVIETTKPSEFRDSIFELLEMLMGLKVLRLAHTFPGSVDLNDEDLKSCFFERAKESCTTLEEIKIEHSDGRVLIHKFESPSSSDVNVPSRRSFLSSIFSRKRRGA